MLWAIWYHLFKLKKNEKRPWRSATFSNSSMTVFHVFKIVQIVPNHEKRHILIWHINFSLNLNNENLSLYHPANIYLFKVNARNTRKSCRICLESTKMTPERLHVNLLPLSISHLFLHIQFFHSWHTVTSLSRPSARFNWFCNEFAKQMRRRVSSANSTDQSLF